MGRNIFGSISQTNARVSLFLFLALFGLSASFFVFADDTTSANSIFQDSDQDGLSNEEEALYGTDPLNKDTDGDGYSDGVEVESGYDPLKPSPGDKLDTTSQAVTSPTSVVTDGSQTMTDQVSSEIANMVQNNGTGEDVTLQSINDAVQKVMSGTADEEIVLPDVNMDDIKIKPISKKLKGEEKAAKEKEQAIEYLTVMAYILANNSPKTFHSENELGSVMSSLATDSLSAIALGNDAYLEKLSEKGAKMLKEINDVEVPEGMLDVHVKAIKMAKYAIQLKDEVKGKQTQDPIGQIASLTKAQGFLAVVADFSQEVFQKLSDYGIQEIPINL